MKKLGIATFIIAAIIISFGILSYIDQPETKESYKIGVLMTGENRSEKLEGMKNGLIQLGYEMDQFEFVIKDAKDEMAQLEQCAEELIEDDLDIIVTLGGIETQNIQEVMSKRSKQIPVVFVGIAAPVELGLINEYHFPGASFTGVNNFHMNLSAKRLEMFVDLVPEMERVVVLYNKNIEISALSLKIVEEAADQLNVEIFPYDVNEDPVLESLENHIISGDGLMILPSYQIEAMAAEIAQFSRKWSLPSMGIYDHEVEKGYLFGYGSSYFGQGYQAARHVSLILQGNTPGSLPVELPDSIEFFVNNEVRKKLNISINEDVLKLAEEIRGDLR